jgi:predicted metal-dependent peptidase
MDLSSENKREYIKRILLSRMRILCNNGFYGLLLMHMDFAIDMKCETAATDGRKIYFGPSFLNNLSDDELDFIMMHEIMHCALQHCLRTGDRDPEAFNIACDIVVNSNILISNKGNLKSITLNNYGESMHIAPNGDEGFNYSAEEVYEMLPAKMKKGGASSLNGNGPSSDKALSGGSWDDHSRWDTADDDGSLKDEWTKNLMDAAEAMSIRDPSNKCGLLPKCVDRILTELRKPQTDWRTILNDFIQEEITDYSFTPPDRRFDESPFFLPDYNEKEDMVKDILFMIDTSGSMSDEEITAAYSEIKGAIDQFNGRLKGWLGFFDAKVVEPKPFANEDEFRIIRPKGGGGTRFDIIFDYVAKHMETPPASIIIMTDGYADFPNEKEANNIPVLWLLVNDGVSPPWGKVARITI